MTAAASSSERRPDEALEVETLLVSIADAVATIVINRPEKRNALNAAVRRETVEGPDALLARADVRVGVITGAGDRAYVAGAENGALAAAKHGAQTSAW